MRLSPLVLIAFFVLSGAHSAFGQSAPGYQAPGKLPVKKESSQTKAARGQAPLVRLYAHLKPDASRIKHLPAWNQRLKRSNRILNTVLTINLFHNAADGTAAPVMLRHRSKAPK